MVMDPCVLVGMNPRANESRPHRNKYRTLPSTSPEYGDSINSTLDLDSDLSVAFVAGVIRHKPYLAKKKLATRVSPIASDATHTYSCTMMDNANKSNRNDEKQNLNKKVSSDNGNKTISAKNMSKRYDQTYGSGARRLPCVMRLP